MQTWTTPSPPPTWRRPRRLAAHKSLDLAVPRPRKEDIAQAQAQLQGTRQAGAAPEGRSFATPVLVSPVNGVVRSRIVEPGEMITPQKPVFSIAITDPKWVRAYIPETDLGVVRQGGAATVVVDSFPNHAFQGWVGFISPVAEFTPKTVQTEELRSSLVYEIRVFVKDPADALKLGMPATVHLPIAQGAALMAAAAPGAPVLVAREVRKGFGRGAERTMALDGVSVQVRHGDLTALVGPDGAGKTTLIRLAAGLMAADGGQMEVLGFDASRDPQSIQDRIAYMPQRFGLYDDLTVQENLDLYADLHGVDAAGGPSAIRG